MEQVEMAHRELYEAKRESSNKYILVAYVQTQHNRHI